MKRLRRLGIEFRVDSDGALRVPARHAEVGDLVASFENGEITVYVGDITHCHFTPGACGPADAEDPVEECVTEAGEWVRDALADRYIFWTAGGGAAGRGGSYSSENPIDTPVSGTRRFVWSGPIRE